MNPTVKINFGCQRVTGQQSMWHRSACSSGIKKYKKKKKYKKLKKQKKKPPNHKKKNKDNL